MVLKVGSKRKALAWHELSCRARARGRSATVRESPGAALNFARLSSVRARRAAQLRVRGIDDARALLTCLEASSKLSGRRGGSEAQLDALLGTLYSWVPRPAVQRLTNCAGYL